MERGGFVGVDWSTVWVTLYGPIITTYCDGVAGARINSCNSISYPVPVVCCSCRRGGTADHGMGASRRKSAALVGISGRGSVPNNWCDFETPAGWWISAPKIPGCQHSAPDEWAAGALRDGVTFVLMEGRRHLEVRQWSRGKALGEGESGLVARTFGGVGNQVDCMGKARRMQDSIHHQYQPKHSSRWR